jgi:signal transduction histidine kinase
VIDTRLTRLFERYRGRYVIWAHVSLVVEVLLIIAPMVSLFPSHYEGLSIGQYLVVLGAADGAALILYIGAGVIHRREFRAVIAWCREPSDHDYAAARDFAFEGPRRAARFVSALGLPAGAGLVVLLAIPHHHTGALDLLELAIGAASSVAIAGVSAWFTLEILMRPVKVALAPPPPDSHRANLPLRLALVIPAAICLSAFALGYLTTTRARAGAAHLMVVYAIAVGCTVFSLVLVVPLFIEGVLTPMRELVRATRDVAAGRLDTRLPVAGTDELGQLAASFNHMLDELGAARTRIVTAGDAARRKVERDLHDGAQQRLVLLKLKLGMLQRDPSRTELLDEIAAELEQALAELRDLARGIYPAALESEGLAGALQQAATQCALPTTLDADGAGRYPRELEAAVYFCCVEALQNAAKHAGGGAHAEVRLRHSDGSLRFEVIDDGAGFDPATSDGSAGLQNMRDRIGALGGELRIESTVGRGTTVTGMIPIDGSTPRAARTG